LQITLTASNSAGTAQAVIQLSVTDQPPVLNLIGDVTVTHGTASTNVTVTASDPDDTLSAASFSVSVKTLSQVAHDLDQQRGFINPGSNFYYNARGQQEKYLTSSTTWYYIFSSGALYQYVANSANTLSSGILIGRLDPSYFADPTLLSNPVTPTLAPTLSTSVTPLGGTSYRIGLSGLAAASGTLQIGVSVTDGVNTVTQPFNLVVADNAPVLQPLTSPVTLSPSGTLPTIALTGSDPDAADVPTLTYSAKVYLDTLTYRAYQLTQTYGLMNPNAPASQPFYFNSRTQSEKYFLGSNNTWYYILPGGSVYRFLSGTSTTINGTLVGTLDNSYYTNPNLVLTATPTDMSSTYVTVTGTGTSGSLNFTPAIRSFSGTMHVVASVSDGALLGSRPFDVVVTDTAPTLAAVTAPAPFSHLATPPAIALAGNDVDGAADIANLQYSAKVYVDNLTYRAYQLTQTYSLVNPNAPASQPFYFNTRFQNEKYLLDSSNNWYYILPTGGVYRFLSGTTNTISGTLLGTLDATYWADPTSLLTATPVDMASTFLTTSGNGTTNGQLNFTSAIQSFEGTLHMVASVSDGILSTTTPRSFDVVVNGAPTLATITAPAPFAHTSTPPTIALNGNDPDGAGDIANLQYSAKVYVDNAAYRASQLTQTYGLAAPSGAPTNNPFYQNTRGQNEKYLLGTGNVWYYVLQDGSFYQYVQNSANDLSSGILLATLDSTYYKSPNTILTAVPTDVSSTYVTVSGNGTTSGQLNFVTSAIQAFTGTLHIQVSVSDGYLTSPTRSFNVIVT
jgi:hypothetical protein